MLWLLAGDDRIAGVREDVEDDRTTVVVIERLPIYERHAWAVRDLPHIRSDPFDRLLGAQAKVEHLTLVSNNTIFDRYEVPRRW